MENPATKKARRVARRVRGLLFDDMENGFGLRLSAGMSELRDFIRAHPRLAILTGAGVSTSSGIPDYRDEQGEWKRARPVEFHPFMTDRKVRQRYWARAMLGW